MTDYPIGCFTVSNTPPDTTKDFKPWATAHSKKAAKEIINALNAHRILKEICSVKGNSLSLEIRMICNEKGIKL